MKTKYRETTANNREHHKDEKQNRKKPLTTPIRYLIDISHEITVPELSFFCLNESFFV